MNLLTERDGWTVKYSAQAHQGITIVFITWHTDIDHAI